MRKARGEQNNPWSSFASKQYRNFDTATRRHKNSSTRKKQTSNSFITQSYEQQAFDRVTGIELLIQDIVSISSPALLPRAG
jgi:hypothetical protein